MNGILGMSGNLYNLNRPVNGAYTGATVQNSQMQRGQQAAQLRRIANSGSDGSSFGTGSARSNNAYGASSIISSSQAQAESIRNSRIKTKETSNKVKKLRYNFKDVSSQIVRSKTSRSARQAASKAHREVLRLKRAKVSGNYDSGEVEAALEHAKSMERVAKKKAAHLEQEELIHITDKPGTNSIAEELKEHPEKLGDKEKDILDELTAVGSEEQAPAKETAADVMSAEFKAAMEAMQEMFEREREVMSEEITEQMSETMDEMMQSMSDMMSELTDQMNEMLENLEMMGELAAVPKEMNEADFKLLVTKHRTDEMKEIAEADKDYLKFIFDKYSKMKAGAAGSGMSAASASVSPAPMSAFSTSAQMPVMDISVPSGGFDVCV